MYYNVLSHEDDLQYYNNQQYYNALLYYNVLSHEDDLQYYNNQQYYDVSYQLVGDSSSHSHTSVIYHPPHVLCVVSFTSFSLLVYECSLSDIIIIIMILITLILIAMIS